MLISTRVRQISGTLSDGGRGGGGEGSDHWSVANVVDRFLPDIQRPYHQSCKKRQFLSLAILLKGCLILRTGVTNAWLDTGEKKSMLGLRNILSCLSRISNGPFLVCMRRLGKQMVEYMQYSKLFDSILAVQKQSFA